MNRKIISKKSCVGKPSHRFLDSQKKGWKTQELIVRKHFQLTTQFKSTNNRQYNSGRLVI